jgi:hypothetical protein
MTTTTMMISGDRWGVDVCVRVRVCVREAEQAQQQASNTNAAPVVTEKNAVFFGLLVFFSIVRGMFAV